MSTGFENGVAIPHPRNPLPEVLGRSIVAFGRTLSGIPFGAPHRQLSDLFFLVLCRDSRVHLHVLARLGRMIQSPGFLDALRAAETSDAAYDVICNADLALGRD
jgi:PTS system nitrogen regulatory IIA component